MSAFGNQSTHLLSNVLKKASISGFINKIGGIATSLVMPLGISLDVGDTSLLVY